jgi:hypothetical protein
MVLKIFTIFLCVVNKWIIPLTTSYVYSSRIISSTNIGTYFVQIYHFIIHFEL